VVSSGGSSSSSSSCVHVPDSCSKDLDWAANTGTKSHSSWYPNFETITGYSLSSATRGDVQLYFVCTGETVNGDCDGLEKPCNRDCGGSDASTASLGRFAVELDFTSKWVAALLLAVLALTVVAFVTLCCRTWGGRTQVASYSKVDCVSDTDTDTEP